MASSRKPAYLRGYEAVQIGTDGAHGDILLRPRAAIRLPAFWLGRRWSLVAARLERIRRLPAASVGVFVVETLETPCPKVLTARNALAT